MFFFLDLFTKLLKRGPLKSFFFQYKKRSFVLPDFKDDFIAGSDRSDFKDDFAEDSLEANVRRRTQKAAAFHWKNKKKFPFLLWTKLFISLEKTNNCFLFYYEQNISFHWKNKTIFPFLLRTKQLISKQWCQLFPLPELTISKCFLFFTYTYLLINI